MRRTGSATEAGCRRLLLLLLLLVLLLLVLLLLQVRLQLRLLGLWSTVHWQAALQGTKLRSA